MSKIINLSTSSIGDNKMNHLTEKTNNLTALSKKFTESEKNLI